MKKKKNWKGNCDFQNNNLLCVKAVKECGEVQV